MFSMQLLALRQTSAIATAVLLGVFTSSTMASQDMPSKRIHSSKTFNEEDTKKMRHRFYDLQIDTSTVTKAPCLRKRARDF